jgi:high affinity Mn2+ porin
VGDSMLPHPGAGADYRNDSYALSASTHLTADYQFIENPGYNTDRGPVNLYAVVFTPQF